MSNCLGKQVGAIKQGGEKRLLETVKRPVSQINI